MLCLTFEGVETCHEGTSIFILFLFFLILTYVLLYIYDVFYKIHDGEAGYYKNGSKRCVTHRLGNRYFYFYFILIFSILTYVLLYIYDVFYEIHDGEAGYYKNGSKQGVTHLLDY